MPLRLRACADGFSMQRRSLLYALAVSLALHVFALTELPRFDFGQAAKPPEAPLQVSVVVAPAPPESAAAPLHRPVPPRANPQPVPKPKSKSGPTPEAVRPAAPPVEPVLLAAGPAESARPAVATDAERGAAAPPMVSAADAPPAADPPAAYPVRAARLVFDLYYGESGTLVGEVVQTWRLAENRYVAESAAEAVGFASLFLGGRYVQRSEGELGPAGFVPYRYTVQDRRKPQPERAEFDWAAGEVRFTRRDKERHARLEPGTQDPLSAVHQLYFMQPLPPGVMLHVATTRKLEAMLFQNMGVEEVITARGPVQARHVKREELDGSITEVWLDPARGFLPVRIRTLNRNGYLLDQRLREASVSRAGEAGPANAANAMDATATPEVSDGEVSPGS